MPRLLGALQHLSSTWRSGWCLTGCHNAQQDPSLRNPWDSPRIMYKSPSVPILSNVTSGMLEKKGLENLSRNIPSIASACVTWQNFPNANPLNSDLKPFLRFGNCLFFPLFPEDQEHGWSNPRCPDPPKYRAQLVVFWTLAFPRVGLYRSAAESDSSPLSYLSYPHVQRWGLLGLTEEHIWDWVRTQEMLDKPCWASPIHWYPDYCHPKAFPSSQKLSPESRIFTVAACLRLCVNRIRIILSNQ